MRSHGGPIGRLSEVPATRRWSRAYRFDAKVHEAGGDVLSLFGNLLEGGKLVIAPRSVRVVSASAHAGIVGEEGERPQEIVVQGGHALERALQDLVWRLLVAVRVALN
jgi:hypothetical protein